MAVSAVADNLVLRNAANSELRILEVLWQIEARRRSTMPLHVAPPETPPTTSLPPSSRCFSGSSTEPAPADIYESRRDGEGAASSAILFLAI